MFCIICKKHEVTNPQNKIHKYYWNAQEIGAHKSALEAEMISRMSIFHKEFVEKKETEISALKKAF